MAEQRAEYANKCFGISLFNRYTLKSIPGMHGLSMNKFALTKSKC